MEIENQPRNRYSRQEMFAGIGQEGQHRLGESSAVIMGCGALGCNAANLLVRAGVGRVRIIDRDFVEYPNLQRQALFTEKDIKDGLPKAIAAQKHLQEINSLVDVEGIIADVNFSNIEKFCSGMDVILDGLDNLETRYLVNDVSQKLRIPYIYGGAIAAMGMTMSMVPGVTPCFRCVFPELPPHGTVPTCETEGVLGPITTVISSLEAAEALKVLVGSDTVNRDLITFDVWNISFERVSIEQNNNCPACNGRYEFLEKKSRLIKSSLCGQSRSIQVTDTGSKGIVFEELAARLEGVQNLTYNEYMLQFKAGPYTLIVFADGRAIIGNTLDESTAEMLYLKYIAADKRQ
jgi:molybdopterin/thiamine biosynthesis adenylyltransferase